jgi:hypothetical protein
LSLFDNVEKYTLSPAKVAVDLGADVLQDGQVPDWKEVQSAFQTKDADSLPGVELTNTQGSEHKREITQDIMRTSGVTLSGLDYSVPPPRPFTLSQIYD